MGTMCNDCTTSLTCVEDTKLKKDENAKGKVRWGETEFYTYDFRREGSDLELELHP